jgi:hypothetical protein
MKGKKATGDCEVPENVLRVLVEDGLRLITQLINNIYETGDWHKDLTEVTMIALTREPTATNCSDHRTISLVAYTAMTVTSILKREFEIKI